MAYVSPQSQPAPTGGILFVNPPGAENYRALRVDVGDQHLFWQSTYQHLLRVEGAFGEFFPQADFSDNGNRVVFTKHIEGIEVLSRSRPLRGGERIPRGEWLRFLETWKSFKRLGGRTDIPDDNRAFIQKFSPPSFDRYPQAYRIYRPHWYSRPRLFILWGLEPVGGGDFTERSPEEVVQEVGRNVENPGQERSSDFLRWLRVAFVCLFAMGMLLLLIWALLPRPVVDFEIEAVASQPAKVRNLTRLDAIVVFGTTSYVWQFDQATPANSEDFEPTTTWTHPGARSASLSATQATLWGLLYKSASLSKSVQVQEPPKPPVPTKEDPVKSSEQPPIGPSSHGFGTVDKPSKSPNRTGNDGRPMPDEPDRPGDKPLPAEKDRPLNENSDPSRPIPGRSMQGQDGKPQAPAKGDDGAPLGPLEDGVPAKPKGESDPSMSKEDGKPAPVDADGEPRVFKLKPVPEEPMKQGSPTPPADKPGVVAPMDQDKGQGTPGDVVPLEPKGGKAAADGSGVPSAPRLARPKARSDGKPRALPMPDLEITSASVVDDGKSQDIDFRLRLPAKVQVERLSIDGKEVGDVSGGGFRARLGLGRHDIHIEYRSTDGEVREDMIQEMLVDQDEIKTYRPKSQLGEKIKLPPAPQSKPESQPPEDEASKINKRIA